MLTKKVKSRISFLILSIALLVASIFFILSSLKDNVLYFLTPTEIKSKEDLEIGRSMRIGGMVKKNSIYTDSKEIKFIITDFKNEIIVSFSGTVPNQYGARHAAHTIWRPVPLQSRPGAVRRKLEARPVQTRRPGTKSTTGAGDNHRED